MQKNLSDCVKAVEKLKMSKDAKMGFVLASVVILVVSLYESGNRTCVPSFIMVLFAVVDFLLISYLLVFDNLVSKLVAEVVKKE